MQLIGLSLTAWGPRAATEFLFGVGVVLVMAGVFLQVRVGHEVMRAEELVKDGRLTEAQASRRIAVVRVAGPLVVLLGVTAFIAVFLA